MGIWLRLETTNWSGKISKAVMKIGILGGTFDPPHIGHQIIAAEALDQLNLDHVLWVLTPFPPHKELQVITSTAHRQNMVEHMVEGNPKFSLSKVDIDRQPPHYAVDTMSLLREQAPNDDFYYLMGLDSLNDLITWHCPADFVNLCYGIVVMLRQGEGLVSSTPEKVISDLSTKLHYLKTPIIEISASDIRSRIKYGRQFRYFVPEKVYQYIFENQLYKI